MHRVSKLSVCFGSAPKVSRVLSIFWGRFGIRTVMKKKKKKKKVSSTFPSTVVAGRKSQEMLDCTQGTEVWVSKWSRVCILPRACAFVIATRLCLPSDRPFAEYIASKQQISYFRKNIPLKRRVPSCVFGDKIYRRSLPFLISLSRRERVCSPPPLSFRDLQVKFRAQAQVDDLGGVTIIVVDVTR